MAAPTEKAALDALKKIQTLSAKDFDARISAEIGDPMLGVFHSLARALFPAAKNDELPGLVHLLALGFLLRGEAKR